MHMCMSVLLGVSVHIDACMCAVRWRGVRGVRHVRFVF